MNSADVREARLRNQRLTGEKLGGVAEAVRWLGAVQAQEYAAAQWALGLRAASVTAADVDAALADGRIIRTHILRPTWHLVAREDLGWMQALSGPRMAAATRPRQLQLGIDEEMVARSQAALADALRGGVFLTRKEAAQLLEDAGVPVDGEGQRLPWLLMRAEFDGVICSGPLNGKQHTYALFAERVPDSAPLTRDEALAELARGYFRARGPATLRDFSWWAGLTLTDCRRAIALAEESLQRVALGETEAWLPASPPPGTGDDDCDLLLLPAFDEYTVAYADRSAVLEPGPAIGDALSYVVVAEGCIIGSWRRTMGKDAIELVVTYHPDATAAARDRLEAEAERYGAFHGLPVRLEFA